MQHLLSFQKTFEELSQWKKAFLIQVGQEGNDSFPMIILANKVDLENREITKQECEQWCRKENVTFYETSAKESTLFIGILFILLGINVDKAFEQIAKLIISKTKEEDIK